jgi:glycosyltransferase involved in cell wall biosynthesis
LFGLSEGSRHPRKLKIGVVAGNLDPRIGGGARFCREILNELIGRSRSEDHEWVIFGEGKEEARLPEAAAFRWRKVPGKNLVERLFSRDLNIFAREVDQERCSLVWFAGGGGFPDPVRCPYLATVWDVQHRTHPYLPEMQEGGEWAYREKKTAPFLRQAAGIIVGTRAGADEIRHFYGISEDRMLLLPHPAPQGFSGVRKEVDPPFFLYPANFWPHKNHATLLRALALLKRREVTLVFTGEGKNRNYLRHLVGRLGLEGRVKFVGHVDDQEVRRLYLSATALVYASLSGPENLPPLEAMAAGCPVLNSDFPGAREQLGEGALFVPPLDPTAWATAMEEVLKAAGEGSIAAKVGQGRRLVQIRTPASYVDGVLNWIEGFGAVRRLWA